MSGASACCAPATQWSSLTIAASLLAQLASEVVRAARRKGLQPPNAASFAERLRDTVTGIVSGPCELLLL